ncbi:MAG: hypothetical protein ACLFV8_03345 [Alphaproteobacteria bacterium]
MRVNQLIHFLTVQAGGSRYSLSPPRSGFRGFGGAGRFGRFGRFSGFFKGLAVRGRLVRAAAGLLLAVRFRHGFRSGRRFLRGINSGFACIAQRKDAAAIGKRVCAEHGTRKLRNLLIDAADRSLGSEVGRRCAHGCRTGHQTNGTQAEYSAHV